MAILEVHHGRGRVERVPITLESPVLFGTSPQCDVVLEGPGIAPFHGRIRWKARSRKFKADASPEVGTLEVNGRKAASAGLPLGAEIRVGPCRIFLLGDDAPAAGAVEARTVVRPAPASIRGGEREATDREATDERTVVQAPPRAGRGLDSPDWLDVLEMAPPSVEVEVLPDEPGSGRGRRRSRPKAAKPTEGGPLGRLRRWFGGEQRPGEERLARSPLVLGLVAAIAALSVLGVVLWRVIGETTARRDFDRSMESFEAGDYRNAVARFERFLAAHPEHPRAEKARVRLALSEVRQFASGAGPSWSNVLKQADRMVESVGHLDEYQDVSVDLAETVLRAAEGLADRARASADAATLAEAERAVALHERVAGPAAEPLRKRSRVPGKLAEARAAVLKARVRRDALAAMDAALGEGSADGAYAARDGLVARYADLAADRDVIARLTKANDLLRRAARFDPSARPGETEPHPDRLGPPLAWVVRDRVRPPAGSGPVVFALADGVAYGVEAATGAPLWQASLGLSSPFPPQAIPGRAADVVVFDARHDELVRLEGRTGRLVWRQATGEPVVDPPLILGNQAIQPTPGGRLLFLDLAGGELQGSIDLVRPLTRTPAADEAGQFLYVLGREANLFIVRRDPPECVAVEYLGHAAGSIPCPPARLGRFLVVPENHDPVDGRWRVLVLEDDGARVRPAQEVPVAGWTWSTPATSGSVIWSAGDRGGVAAYAIGPYESKAPFAPIASLVPDARPSGPAFALARGEREAWVASGRSARLELDVERGQVRASWTLGEAGPALAPIQPAGGLAVLTQQPAEGGGATLWGVEPDSGRPRWRTTLGSAWPVAPSEAPDGRGLVALGPDGSPLDLPTDRVAAGGFVEAAAPGPGEYRLPPIGARRIDLGGRIVVVPEPTADVLLVRDPGNPEARRVPLPAPLAAPATPWGGDLLVPGGYGRAYLVDPATGASRADPFVPPYDRSKPGRWLAPAPLEGDALAMADAAGVVRRFERPTSERPRLAPAREVNLGEAIVADPASTGDALIVATADGRVRALAARDLSPVGAWALEAPLAGGPWAVAGHAFAADAAGGLTAFGPDGRRLWRAESGAGFGSEPAGPPAAVGGSVVWLDRAGTLHRRALSDGADLGRADLGVTPAGGPLVDDGRLVVPAGTGSLRLIDEAALPAGEGVP